MSEHAALGRLALLARRAPAAEDDAGRRWAGEGKPPAAQPSVCDLCAGPLPSDHRHLLDLDTGEPQCACRACTILFDRAGAGGGHYRLIPERRLRLRPRGGDRLWAALGIPVDLAFLTRESRSARVVSRYPGALGLIAGIPADEAWKQAIEEHPELDTLEPDVETLLMNRTRGAQERWIVPIDDGYRLAGLVSLHWRGFGGGDDVWRAIAGFFTDLQAKEAA